MASGSPQLDEANGDFMVSTAPRMATETCRHASAAGINIDDARRTHQLRHELTATQMYLPPEVLRTPQLPPLR